MESASPPLHDVVGSGHALMEVMKETAVCCLHAMCLNSNTNYRIAEKFHWCKISRLCVQTLQKKYLQFLFLQNKRNVLTTPLSVDGHVPHANQRNDTEQQSE